MSKTVFILGAGFSADAGVPSQANLIKKVIEEADNNHESQFKSRYKNFQESLQNFFLLKPEQIPDFPLEDIFTPLDRCLADNITFRQMTRDQMIQLREDIYYLIAKTIDTCVDSNKVEYIKDFAIYLLSLCKSRIEENVEIKDPVSVISTNWDILLDKFLYKEISSHNSQQTSIDGDKKNLRRKCVVDYCCYVSSYDKDDHWTKPGLEAIGAGGFNVKLLKLHGSLNWLQCPRCARVYVSFDEKITLLHFEQNLPCRHCDSNYGVRHEEGLTSNLIMPTFLKSFLKTQYKLIWDNAGVELAEAAKIVFIGYSLPEADFEMRQLLSRMVRNDAKIEVVTVQGAHLEGLEKRYKNFFGSRNISLLTDGASDYITALNMTQN